MASCQDMRDSRSTIPAHWYSPAFSRWDSVGPGSQPVMGGWSANQAHHTDRDMEESCEQEGEHGYCRPKDRASPLPAGNGREDGQHKPDIGE